MDNNHSEMRETSTETYYAHMEAKLRMRHGVLDEENYTAYSRVILALSAMDLDARNVAGYDLTKPLGDFEKTVRQGLNGPVWALLALDSRHYPVPENPEAAVQATKQMYIDHILSCQLKNGGWNLTGEEPDADPDMTGMALQALAAYREQDAVEDAVKAALICMSLRQTENGGFAGAENCESCVQMINALCALKIPLNDPRFVKNGSTLLTAMLLYYRPGEGFCHCVEDDAPNRMATEQGLYALATIHHAVVERAQLRRLREAKMAVSTDGFGLPGKNAAVRKLSCAVPGATFSDICGHLNQAAMEALAERALLDVSADGCFCPDTPMRRDMFVTLLLRALGLTPQRTGVFFDVDDSIPCGGYIDTAHRFGIVAGVGGGRFNPGVPITRQQAAVIAGRAATFCGMGVEPDSETARDVLIWFSDYTDTGEWARPYLALCYDTEILPKSDQKIRPYESLTRGEAAQMVYNLLAGAALL